MPLAPYPAERFVRVDWEAAANLPKEGPEAALARPHDFTPYRLLQVLEGFFPRLASSQPEALVQALGGALCAALESGAVQVGSQPPAA